jgi:hypothetical protein
MFSVDKIDTKIDQKRILELADEMAAAATNFKGQGYEIFIKTREQFKETLELFMQGKFKEK